MLFAVEGIYRDGKIELAQTPTQMIEPARVIVTFLDNESVDLIQRGMAARDIKQLRERLANFGEEWDSPEMSVYDNYTADTNTDDQTR